MIRLYLIVVSVVSCAFATAEIKLPPPLKTSKTSLESTLFKRRSLRRFSSASVSLPDVGQLLWAAQGVTHPSGYRTTPSAGALYPLVTYVVAGNVSGLAPGLYRYSPREHSLELLFPGDHRRKITRAALNQTFIKQAPAIIVFTAVYTRVTNSYGKRGVRYVDMEAGHAAQNVYLQAVSLGLGTVVVGAFSDERIQKSLHLQRTETPLYIMPVGNPMTRRR